MFPFDDMIMWEVLLELYALSLGENRGKMQVIIQCIEAARSLSRKYIVGI